MPKGIYERKPFTKEHKKHMSESQKGRSPSTETRLKMSLASKGHLVTEETKEKLRKANIGKKHTEESLLKMSKSQKGNKNGFYGKSHTEKTKKIISKVHKGKTTWMKGKHHTEEAKQKNRDSSLGKHHTEEAKQKISKATKGENNPNWKGGIEKLKDKRHTMEYREWRLMVFGRDNFTCQDCGKRGDYLEAHHIKSYKEYPELRFDINNGETLCKVCHNKLHCKITLKEEV